MHSSFVLMLCGKPPDFFKDKAMQEDQNKPARIKVDNAIELFETLKRDFIKVWPIYPFRENMISYTYRSIGLHLGNFSTVPPLNNRPNGVETLQKTIGDKTSLSRIKAYFKSNGLSFTKDELDQLTWNDIIAQLEMILKKNQEQKKLAADNALAGKPIIKDPDGHILKTDYVWLKVQDKVKKYWKNLQDGGEIFFPSVRSIANAIGENQHTVKKAIAYDQFLVRAYNNKKPAKARIQYIDPAKLTHLSHRGY